MKKRELKFKEVKNYLREHPGTAMNTLCEETDVSQKMVEQWVREERLVFGEDSPLSIACEGCGRPIKSGKYCSTCVAEMRNSLKGITKKKVQQKKELPVKKHEKMHYLD